MVDFPLVSIIVVNYNRKTNLEKCLNSLMNAKYPISFYGLPRIALIIAGIIFGVQFLDAYLNEQTVFYGSLLGSVIMFLIGSILLATAVILFTMSNLMRERQ